MHMLIPFSLTELDPILRHDVGELSIDNHATLATVNCLQKGHPGVMERVKVLPCYSFGVGVFQSLACVNVESFNPRQLIKVKTFGPEQTSLDSNALWSSN